MNYLENSPLCLSLGNTPALIILSFLIAHRNFDYSKTEISRNTGLARQTVYRGLEPLERFGMIKENRKIGQTTLYTLDGESEAVEDLIKFNKSIVKLIVNEGKGQKISKGKMEDFIKELGGMDD